MGGCGAISKGDGGPFAKRRVTQASEAGDHQPVVVGQV
jgi:hypothetical protein